MGLGAGAGLAFSFVRRARQLVWIAIGMLVLAAMGWRREARRGSGHRLERHLLLALALTPLEPLDRARGQQQGEHPSHHPQRLAAGRRCTITTSRPR